MTESWKKVTCIIAPDVADLYLAAAQRILPLHDLAALTGPPEQRTAVLNGVVLEHLVADFLAGPDPREAP